MACGAMGVAPKKLCRNCSKVGDEIELQLLAMHFLECTLFY